MDNTAADPLACIPWARDSSSGHLPLTVKKAIRGSRPYIGSIGFRVRSASQTASSAREGRRRVAGLSRIAVAARSRPAAIFAFDLLAMGGKDLRPLPLVKRKALLQQQLGRTERLFAEADRLGLEGIIAKKADSPYRRGRTPNWVKIKTAHGRHIDEERAK
jgi:hypothetical protein